MAEKSGMLKEFRDFAMKGNVVDMAVGIVIGGAFGAIVKSFVDDIIMPPIGLVIGNVPFKDLKVVLKESTDPKIPPVAINYGSFINLILSFIIIALAVFIMVKALQMAKRKEAAAPAPEPTTKECPECQMTIPVKAKRCGHCTSVIA